MRMNSKKLFITLAVVIAVFASCIGVMAEDTQTKTQSLEVASSTFRDMYEKINPAIVYIAVKIPATSSSDSSSQQMPYGFDWQQFFGNPDQDQKDQPEEQQYSYASGTGFVYDKEGHIVTNNHVIADAVEVKVTYSDGLMRDAKVLGADPDSDLAVLSVDNYPTNIEPVTIGDSTTIKPGDLAAVIGNPFGNTGTMTQGIISALHRSFTINENENSGSSSSNGNYTIPDMIQTDAAINPGNSGGVLLNLNGEVIGVVNSLTSSTYSSAGIGYAIPSSLVKRVIPSLIKDGEYQHPWLGLSGIALTPDVSKELGLENTDQRGALVQSVTKNGPAEKAGIQGGTKEVTIETAKITTGGDIITKIDDQDVKGMDDIISYLAESTDVGQDITLHIIRDGKEQDVKVTLAARPTQAQRSASTTDENKAADEGNAWLGIYGTDLSSDVLDAMGLDKNTQGALVVEVSKDSPAEDAGIIGSSETKTINGKDVAYGGDIIQKLDGKDVASMSDLKSMLQDYKPGEKITLSVLRDGKSQDVDVRLGNTNAR